MRASIACISDRRGVSAIEFAICLPFLILLFTGGFQLNDAMAANRKVTTATRTIADLTSRVTTVTDADLDTILNASNQVMAPYLTDNATLTVTQVKTDNNMNSTVDWSRGKNASGLKATDPFNLPSDIKQRNTSVIVAQINYAYRPMFAGSLIGTIPLRETIIMSPRLSQSVEHK